jgi:hypothetical protein
VTAPISSQRFNIAMDPIFFLDTPIIPHYSIYKLSYHIEVSDMNTKKVAITIPADLVVMIDDISKNQGLSRSKYISIVLQEKISNEKKQQIKDSYNRVFSDDTIKKEQLQTAIWFDGTGNQGGQEW